MIAEAIAKYIDENGITQSSLCEKTGLPEQTVKMSFCGEKKMSIEEYIVICTALDVSYEYFFKVSKK